MTLCQFLNNVGRSPGYSTRPRSFQKPQTRPPSTHSHTPVYLWFSASSLSNTLLLKEKKLHLYHYPDGFRDVKLEVGCHGRRQKASSLPALQTLAANKVPPTGLWILASISGRMKSVAFPQKTVTIRIHLCKPVGARLRLPSFLVAHHSRPLHCFFERRTSTE